MKSFFSKGIYLFITAIILLSLPLPAFATSSGSCGDDVSWTFSGTTLTISGEGEMDSYTDDNLAPWYAYADNITSVVVESGVTRIGKAAFYNCTSLTQASLPDTLEKIGDYAFENCTLMSYVAFPEALTSIGEGAFKNCARLNGVILPSGLKSIDDYAFYRCSSLTSITVPESVVNFGAVVFAYCESLISADIRSSIVSIPDWTFYNCKNLVRVSLPETVTSAGELTFHDCNNLEGIYYTGESTAALIDSLNIYDGKGSKVIEDEAPADSLGAVSTENSDSTKEKTTVTKVVTTDNDLKITITTDEEKSFMIDGETSTVQDAIQAAVNNTSDGGVAKDVTVSSKKSTVISTTVSDEEDWAELTDKVKEVLRENQDEDSDIPGISTVDTTSSTVEVEVQIKDSSIKSENLAELAGKDAVVIITTADGDKWRIDESTKNRSSYTEDEYDLNVTIEKVDDPSDVDIASNEVYKVNFDSSIDFEAQVGVNVRVGNANQYATLFVGDEQLQTVVIDNDGYAWFGLSKINKSNDYYVGINVEGVSAENAIIPDSLYEEYGLDEEGDYLYDAEGNRYVVGETTSSWGITGTQFAIYVGIGVGVLVLIVTLVMTAINKNSKSKAKYAAMKERDEARSRAIARRAVEKAEETGEKPETRYEELDIDEDELRLKVMQEMLEEAKRKK